MRIFDKLDRFGWRRGPGSGDKNKPSQREDQVRKRREAQKPGRIECTRNAGAAGHASCSRQGLYDPSHEHDACGVGFIANIKGHKSHSIIEDGLKILANLTHRGAVGADPKAGDVQNSY